MTDQADTSTAEARERQAREAQNFALQAVHGLAFELGSQPTRRPMFRDDPDSPPVRDVGPEPGMRAPGPSSWPRGAWPAITSRWPARTR